MSDRREVRVHGTAGNDTPFAMVETASMPWMPTATPGFWRKVLHEDTRSGRSTSLVRIDPGGISPVHSHTAREQIFVIEGTFRDQARTYRAGDFLIREPGAKHEASSDGGALLLVVF